MGLARPFRIRIVLLIVLTSTPCAIASAQEVESAQAAALQVEPKAKNLDERWLYGIYNIDSQPFRVYMYAANISSYPVFIGAPAAAWSGAALFRASEDRSDAYRLLVSEAAAYASFSGLKLLFRRPRPYQTLEDVEVRYGGFPALVSRDPYSFPSGHAALSFAAVTSWSLSHPRWYVIGPGIVWAGGVALSRVWRGLHYPGDVAAGALLGAAAAGGVHLLGSRITPDFLRDEGDQNAMPLLYLRLGIR